MDPKHAKFDIEIRIRWMSRSPVAVKESRSPGLVQWLSKTSVAVQEDKSTMKRKTAHPLVPKNPYNQRASIYAGAATLPILNANQIS